MMPYCSAIVLITRNRNALKIADHITDLNEVKRVTPQNGE